MSNRRPSLRLVVLPVSPWSERARWALDHHHLAYETVEHAPFLGELGLRRLVGPGKQATVPVLIADGRAITDSWPIALYADREGRGAPLIPPGREPDVRAWNDLADATKRAGRGLIVASMLASPAALDEGFPPAVPRALRPLLRPVARYGARWFARKYALRLDEAPAQLAALRATFTKLREALAESSPYLLGGFSYADIVMATCLQAIKPVDDRYLPLGPATRKVWTRDDLAAEFSDLVAWRDGLYEKHRAPRA
ncbi:MAG TPA: glutathione S-transferase N-terminal domain-containing protein [Polyangiaceae bacterium]|nr:glutathione S-transferase N-terminal domain-containing protein [Polyangiaceae bacterium]